jgi:DNA-directed RNA polymerase subunit RPC12/RpoP
MDISFTCDKCGKHLVVDEAGAGITIDCPECGKPIYVPSSPPPSRQDTPVRVEVKPATPKSKYIPAPAPHNNPLLPPSSTREKSTVHPSIEAGVHCLLILVGILFVGFMLIREDVFWAYPVMGVATVFGTAAFLCAVYGMCHGHVRHGLLVLAGLSLIVGVSSWVGPSIAMAAGMHQAEEMQQQMFKQFQK